MNTTFAELTTMRVGGAPHTIAAPATEAELIEAALAVWSSGEPWLVIGGGSNLLVSDDGFDGTLIRVLTGGIEVLREGERPRIRVQAGEPWDALVDYTVAQGWAGIEALSGIPGSSGAAPMQNIGAYGQEIAETLIAIDFLDYVTGEVMRVPAAELDLGYRTSALKAGRQGIVLAIELELAASGFGVVGYEQLATALGVSVGDRVVLVEIRRRVLELRASKGMVLDQSDPDSVSCGSFFTNPIVSENFARSLPKDSPRWPVGSEEPAIVVPLGQASAERVYPDDREVKLSAAWLIEHAGVVRGFSLPGSLAAISSKHTLAITNRGGATASEVAELARYIRTRVSGQFGVNLQVEPVAVGLEL